MVDQFGYLMRLITNIRLSQQIILILEDDVELKILILAPHTDDGELGCGGTIVKHIEKKDLVYYVAFSKCEESVPDGFPKDILASELYKATETLGIDRSNVTILDYPVRRFSEYRQEILNDMIKLRSRINPQIVYVPSIHDTHQDHNVIAEEARRAYKHICLYAYEVPWNNFEFSNQLFNVLSETQIETKLRAINCYQSQQSRDYSSREFVFGQAKYHGVQAGEDYAEVFEVVRQVKD